MLQDVLHRIPYEQLDWPDSYSADTVDSKPWFKPRDVYLRA
jgi:hypothetical protein